MQKNAAKVFPNLFKYVKVNKKTQTGEGSSPWGEQARKAIVMGSEQYIKIPAKLDSRVLLRAISGHFATSQSHITRYLDIMAMKSRCNEARGAAELLSRWYESTIPVDTILCMDGMEVVGTYLAEELTKVGVLSYNAHKSLYVMSPEYLPNGQIIFRDNMKMAITRKNILILMGSVTTGKTFRQVLNSVRYYEGNITGACAVFSAVEQVQDIQIHSIFQPSDVSGYESYKPEECPYCRQHVPISGIVNGFGVSALN